MKFTFIKKFSVLIFLATALFISSCDNDKTPEIPIGEAGFFVVNEGGWGNGNTSLSFYDRKSGEMFNNVFTNKNGRPLGDQAQSMSLFENKGYIVVQNSKKIEVIDASDYSSIATITEGITSPRYFLGISATKAYVSDWGADGLTGTVKVIDLSTNKVISSIPTGKGSNRMLKIGNLVYVTNKGGYGKGNKDNTVVVIDSDADKVIHTITLGDNPNSLQKDIDGNIWVCASGEKIYKEDWSVDEVNSTKGSISKITPDHKVVLTLKMDKISISPDNLEISPAGNVLYYTYDGSVFAMPVTATELPTKAMIQVSYYGLAVDPFNGNIIGCKAPDFQGAGNIQIYDQFGVLQKNILVGIGPNSCTFK